jgi:hypothetical protein
LFYDRLLRSRRPRFALSAARLFVRLVKTILTKPDIDNVLRRVKRLMFRLARKRRDNFRFCIIDNRVKRRRFDRTSSVLSEPLSTTLIKPSSSARPASALLQCRKESICAIASPVFAAAIADKTSQ